jgi:hypothetical protein
MSLKSSSDSLASLDAELEDLSMNDDVEIALAQYRSQSPSDTLKPG